MKSSEIKETGYYWYSSVSLIENKVDVDEWRICKIKKCGSGFVIMFADNRPSVLLRDNYHTGVFIGPLEVPCGKSQEPSCYTCKHINVCAFYESISDAIQRHIGWVDAHRPEPDWQRIIDALAFACDNYKKKPDETRQQAYMRNPQGLG